MPSVDDPEVPCNQVSAAPVSAPAILNIGPPYCSGWHGNSICRRSSRGCLNSSIRCLCCSLEHAPSSPSTCSQSICLLNPIANLNRHRGYLRLHPYALRFYLASSSCLSGIGLAIVRRNRLDCLISNSCGNAFFSGEILCFSHSHFVHTASTR